MPVRVSLTLGGFGASAVESAQALYASGPSGHPILITATGRKAPGGATFTEMGVPSMAPDGRVFLGAEFMDTDRTSAMGHLRSRSRGSARPAHRARNAADIVR